jgi:hypothetical protein
MNSHTVIYLDEMYLSNMAKAQLGSLTDQYECEFWLSLLEELKDKVLADRIACPEFAFQREEASFDTRIDETVGRIIDELSRGLKFNTWKEILNLQIEDAAFKFLGKAPPQRETWEIAFPSNPQASLKSRMPGGYPRPNWGADVYPALQNGIVEDKRQQKAMWVTFAEKTLGPYTCHNWDETLQRDKLYSVDCILGHEAWRYAERLRSSGFLEDRLIAAANMQEMILREERLLEIGINDDNFIDFLKSDELLDSAFIDIHSSIRTAAAMYFPKRKQLGSDLRDPVILAVVMPYSDVVTTDRFMKELLVARLNLDEKYDCAIFSANKRDRSAFRDLIRSLG